ncbi:ABC transporter substrate-binding protein [Marinobacter halodurans]|uniref:High-affinity zinc uptake system protein ZnuA n=1 Tax=Marinobacter halodurans TaxID=2528979 RepID=A0ABY1ZF46_9GAMM|nr:zinc ABC transporter substrate-binding protein [Marinobacter halodurans]TBW48621.1 ABC transporter substrate-binding protein [Marinobacter halodurans]
MHPSKILLASALTLGLASQSLIAHAAETLHVVTTIHPLSLLARAIAPDNIEITTLVPAGASPHTYQLRPSDRRALANADLILWVGPDMETFLEKLMNDPALTPQVQALMPPKIAEAAAAHMHEEDEQGLDPDDHDEHEHGHDEGHGHHHHGGIDPHVWLDPTIAATMAETIRDRLAAIDPDDADTLNQRLETFEKALRKKDADLKSQLSDMDRVDLFTYHDAFRRFAEHYGLHVTEALTITPEQTPGARHLSEVQAKLAAADTPCLLTEPQFSRDWWHGLTRNVDVTITTWDPLGSDVPVTQDGYLNFQQALADSVLSCLPEKAQH